MSSTKTDSVVAYLDRFLRVSEEPDREGNGISVRAKDRVTRIGAAVNTSMESIRRAAEEQVDFLLVHHTSWREIDLQLTDYKFERLRREGISLYSAHEVLDRTPDIGCGDMLAALLGIEAEGRFASGYGVYGSVSAPSFSDLVDRAGAALGVPIESWENAPNCRKAGIVTGAAGLTTRLKEAKDLGCDTYITGEGSMYTKLFAREIGVNLVFGSHYATEFPGIKALAERTATEFGLPWTAIPEDLELR